MKTDDRKDVYSEITNTIVSELEKGVMPWVPNWDSPMPCRPMRATEEPYRGINVLLLWMAAAKAGFQSPYWFTYRQVATLGGFVRKGEKSSAVVYVGSMAKTERDEEGEETEREVAFLRQYAVFNLQQTERMPERYHGRTNGPSWPISESEAVEVVDRFFTNTGAEIVIGPVIPHYSILSDRVHMPPLTAFKSANDYYATLAHEMTHWTGHPSRSPRDFRAIIGSPANYAREELVAELGAAFLCADLELSLQPREDHAEYIATWLKILRNDKRAIFQASAMAQRAVDYLHGLQFSEPIGKDSLARCVIS
jgi:antirestriction protein ArdC